MNSILDNLNNEQRLPAQETEGAVLVTAGAGSGKTRLLTHRIAHLICDMGVLPSNILAITFTNKSANEMKERLERMIGATDGMWVCTFHAMCSRILRSHIENLGYTKSFTIYGDVEKERLIKRILAEKNTNMTVDTIAWHISNAKNHLLDPEEYSTFIPNEKKREIIITVYEEYEKEMKRCNALDFDDLLVKTYNLLKNFKEIREYYQNKFRYIHVDEFQDTNEAQYELIKILAEKHGNVFVVGDEDQCIYSWRGAEANNVVDFTKDFKNCKVFKLEQNYRSTKKIIERANCLIKRNQNRLAKNLWTDNGEGARVEEFTAYNDLEEAEFVAQTIKSLVEERGYNYKDFAILMRVNALSRVIEEKLITYGVPYKIYGGFKFFERKEVKDTIAYLKVIANPFDDDAFVRVLGFPKKGIGDVTINNIRLIALENETSMYQTVMSGDNLGDALNRKLAVVKDLFNDLNSQKSKMGLYDFVVYLIDKVGIKEAIGKATEEDVNKVMNIDDFAISVSEFEKANEGATIEDFLQSITLMRDIDTLEDEQNFASLMTVHSAKGLEFNVVFIVGLVEGLFPLTRAILSDNPNELEEERRLMYVAITRAKERLYLTHPRTRFSFETKRTEYCAPSRFLKESAVELIDDLENSPVTRQRMELGELRQAQSLSNRAQNVASKVNVIASKSQPSQKQESALSKYKISDFKKGTKVLHPHFGQGEVILEVTDFTGAFVTIRFDGVGIKTLSLKYANLEIIG